MTESPISAVVKTLQKEEQRDRFVGWCQQGGVEDAARILLDDWERMVTFCEFPKEHWQHLKSRRA